MITLTHHSQLAQLSVHEPEPGPEPKPEPEVATPVAAGGDQGLTAIAQYDYEVRVWPAYGFDFRPRPAAHNDRPQRTMSCPFLKASISWVLYKKTPIGGLALVRTELGVVCSPHLMSLSSMYPSNPSRCQSQKLKRLLPRPHLHLHPLCLQSRSWNRNPSLRLVSMKALLRLHYMSAQDILPSTLTLWIIFISAATTQRKTTNCPSAKVTGSLKLRLSRKIGGPVVTNMAMSDYSRVRVFTATIFGIMGHGRD